MMTSTFQDILFSLSCVAANCAEAGFRERGAAGGDRSTKYPRSRTEDGARSDEISSNDTYQWPRQNQYTDRCSDRCFDACCEDRAVLRATGRNSESMPIWPGTRAARALRMTCAIGVPFGLRLARINAVAIDRAASDPMTKLCGRKRIFGIDSSNVTLRVCCRYQTNNMTKSELIEVFVEWCRGENRSRGISQPLARVAV